MNTKISTIRHKNARHILENKCDGKVINMAKKLDKAQQQVSNFCRKNAPVKIGTKIAREIEKAFDYPYEWLDIEHKNYSKNPNDSSMDTLTGLYPSNNVIEATESLFEKLDYIEYSIINHSSDDDHEYLLRRLNQLTHRLEYIKDMNTNKLPLTNNRIINDKSSLT